MLETALQLERDPPETDTSDSMKSVAASERVKVRVAVSPAPRELSASSSVMAMVGAVRSVSRKTRTCPALFSLSSLNTEPMATVLPSRDREILPPL